MVMPNCILVGICPTVLNHVKLGFHMKQMKAAKPDEWEAAGRRCFVILLGKIIWIWKLIDQIDANQDWEFAKSTKSLV